MKDSLALIPRIEDIALFLYKMKNTRQKKVEIRLIKQIKQMNKQKGFEYEIYEKNNNN